MDQPTWATTQRSATTPAVRDMVSPNGHAFRAVKAGRRRTILSGTDQSSDWDYNITVNMDEDDVESVPFIRDLVDGIMTLVHGFAKLMGGSCGDVNVTASAGSAAGGA